MKSIRVLFVLILFQGIGISQWNNSNLIISEIMFYAPSGNNEFIEVYNKSETAYVDLYGFKIKYYTSNTDSIISAGYGTILPPKSFAVIFEGDYSFTSGIYNPVIPLNALKLKIDDNAFGTNGMANTTDRPIRLINYYNDTIDYCTYNANNISGYSDEKIILNNDTSSSNWNNSLRYLGSPGYKNSISPSLQDIFLKSIRMIPAAPFEYSAAELEIISKNIGLNTSGNFSLLIYDDTNLDSIPSPSELIQTYGFNSLQHNDSTITHFQFTTGSAGKYNFIAQIVYEGDEDTLNNVLMLTYNVFHGSGAINKIVINEIMYAPSSGHPEWVELFNRSDEIINLKKWKLSDNSSTATLTSVNKYISPGSFVVLCKDTSIYNFYRRDLDLIIMTLPQLNNAGDKVVLKDSLSNIIDSLDYLPSWGGSTGGFSLERINVNEGSLNEINWETCKNRFKGTPGQINSVTPKNNDLAVLSLTAPKYTILGHNLTLSVRIKNDGLLASSNYVVNFYYDQNNDSTVQSGELISSIPGVPLISKDSIDMKTIFNIFNEGKNNFIVKIIADEDDDTDNNINFVTCTGVKINEIRNDLVINEIMYAPETSHPEYIELFNKSTKAINIKNYSIADANDTIKVVINDLLLIPAEYLVIASDSSFYKYFHSNSKIIIKDFPSLNNTGDTVVLIDSLERVIDSLVYSPLWGGTKGCSLERLNSNINSIDSVNWRSSVSKYKGTPGYINSVSLKTKDIESKEIIFTPLYPVKGDNVSISLKLKNNGTSNAIVNVTLFEDTDIDSVADFEWQSMNDIFVNARDSVTINFAQQILGITSSKGFYCITDFPGDQDTSNNYIYAQVIPGVIPSSIIINEVMYSPGNGEPEWIEFFNKSNESILLKDWQISDVITTPSTAMIKDSVSIAPKSYLIISSDSSIYNYHLVIPANLVKMTLPSLNNTGDGVVLKDNRKLVIDSVLFAPDWGGQVGCSLERISPENISTHKTTWGSSKDIEGSTPGRVNSLKKKKYDAAVSGISIFPRFPIPGDNISISAILKNNGSQNADNLQASFYYKTNKTDSLIGSKNNIFIPAEDSLEITIPEKLFNLQTSTTIVIKISFTNDEDTVNNTLERKITPGIKEKSLIINEIMYDPDDNEPEWLELYNPTENVINVKDWFVSDIVSPTETIISTDDLFINPGDFLIIARDTSFKSIHPEGDIIAITAKFGTLGNTGDGIILYDFRHGIVDSVYYKSTWGHKKGFSIERFSSTASSTDSSNWEVSIASGRSTPGKANSLIYSQPSDRQSIVINEIMYDPAVDNCEFVELYNNSEKDINIAGWNISDKYKAKTRIAESNMILKKSNYFVIASDSCFLSKYNSSGKNISIVNKSDLGLTSDGIVFLKDLYGNLIDSVHYSDKWHNKVQHVKKDKSLERISPSIQSNDPLNWSTSVSLSGATPGEKNSVYLDNQNSLSELSIFPNPFSPDNDGYEDVAFISYRFNFPLSSLLFKIFDSKGRLVKSIAGINNSSAEGSIIFDGNGDDNIPLRMGIYILLAEGRNYITGEVKIIKSSLVIARRLN